LIAASARELGRGDYNDAQIDGALEGAWGVDTQLIEDGTYWIAFADDEIVACGGWSRRATLFGSDREPGRSPALLDPLRDAARIRAFFVRPDWARRGIGTLLLQHCESEASVHGFRTLALMATLPGWRLYQRHGFVGDERRTYALANGLSIEFIPMTKALA
jgi:GNAT superfamily N-acetyltransferase